MIVEMRTYQIKPGLRDRFLRIFEDLSIPEHRRLGMPIAGPFLDVENANRFFFMRSFPNMAAREELKNGFYEGQLWKEQLEAELMPMLEHYDVVVVEDPSGMLVWHSPCLERAEEEVI